MVNRKHNASFSYRIDGETRSFDVVLTSFGYSWSQMTTGSSSRQYQVVYPKRVEQSDLSISLQFYDVDEYLAFAEYMRKAHLMLTSYNNPPDLFFVCDEIGVKYSVAIEKVPVSVSYDTVAPKMQLTMKIIRDMLDFAIVSVDEDAAQVGSGVIGVAVNKATDVRDADELFRSEVYKSRTL